MGRYFFDVNDGSEVFADSDRTEYPSVEVARHHALELLVETAGNIMPKSASDEFSVAVKLKDARGNDLMTTVLRSEVRLDSLSPPQCKVADVGLEGSDLGLLFPRREGRAAAQNR